MSISRTRSPVRRRVRVTAAVAVAAAVSAGLAGCSGDEVVAGAPVPSTSRSASAEVGQSGDGQDAGTPAPGAPTSGTSTTGGDDETAVAATPTGTDPTPDEPVQGTGSSGAEGTPSPAEGTPDADEAAPEAGTSPSGPAFEADDGEESAQASGGPLSVVSVRTGRHDGFDRVVLELDGAEAGQPGWFARYVDAPAQEGSGDPVAVAGSAYLELQVTGTGYPFDTGVEEFLGRVPGEGTALVREVVVGGVFEGQAQVLVGLDERADYRVTRLSDPARVVVDVLG